MYLYLPTRVTRPSVRRLDRLMKFLQDYISLVRVFMRVPTLNMGKHEREKVPSTHNFIA